MARNVLIYLDKDSLSFFAPGRREAAKLVLPSSVVSELEVVDSQQLEKLVGDFQTQRKITRQDTVMILSENVTFDKNFSAEAENLEENKQSFLETVPFEDIHSKEIIRADRISVVATNRSFYQAVKSAWEKSGGAVKMVIPEVFLPDKFDIKKPSALEKLLQGPSGLADLSLIEAAASTPVAHISREATRQFALNKNLRLLLIIFLASIAVLVAAFLASRR